MDAVTWIEDFFDSFADQDPTTGEKFIGFNFKHELYDLYARDKKDLAEKPISKSNFLNLWLALLPECRLREKVSVLGKCSLCSKIDEKRKEVCSQSVGEALRHCHYLHRGGLIMAERAEYQKHIAMAKKFPTRVFSCVIDGMDQSHSELPSKGSQDKFNNPLHHMIQGCIVHGKGMVKDKMRTIFYVIRFCRYGHLQLFQQR